ncbi:MAG TPA: polysaccharide deacetylase family protein [Segetibacter sp.]
MNKVLVLMYHRITNLKTDPWQLAVAPANFKAQVEVLKERFNVISVKSLVEQLEKGRITDDGICLTFDDAYYDNFYYAKPILEELKCLATFFIPTQYIGQKTRFWWDDLQNIILDTAVLPQTLSLTINESHFAYTFTKDIILTAQQSTLQKAWLGSEPPPTERCELYLELWKFLKPLSYKSQMAVLEKIRDWAKPENEADALSCPMDINELKELNAVPLFHLGLHTTTHPALASHPYQFQQKEISDNRNRLRDISNNSLNIIAYPYGNYNETTLSVLKDENIAAAFTTEGNPVTERSSIFQLGRFLIPNWDGRQFENHLNGWMYDNINV